MPELPEVETVRRDLKVTVMGKRVEHVAVSGHRTVRRQDKSRVIEAVQGRRLNGFRRRGKFLLFDLSGRETLVVHLRMSGQLLWRAQSEEAMAPHTHAVLHFGSAGRLDFVDPRTFGEMWVTSPDVPELQHLGPDAFDEPLDFQRLHGRRGALKACLMNQSIVAGIGNIYSDEICWHARVRPDRPPFTLDGAEVELVHRATAEVLAAAVDRRGSTLKDRQYVDLFGRPGRAQEAHRVYARAGQPCFRCGAPLERLHFGQRSAVCCATCQLH